MTVSELIAKLKDCAPNAEVVFLNREHDVERVMHMASDGVEVVLS